MDDKILQAEQDEIIGYKVYTFLSNKSKGENKGFNDGKAWFDGKEITADLFKQMIEEKFQKHDERSI